MMRAEISASQIVLPGGSRVCTSVHVGEHRDRREKSQANGELDSATVHLTIQAMSSVFAKLNLKDQRALLILNAPESFDAELAALEGVTVHRNAKPLKSLDFALAFGTKLKDVEAFAKIVAKKSSGDAVIWFAYPKGSSRRYTCEFNRDTGWTALGQAGYEPVRQVAVDEDWSALRFRKVAFIKTMTRRTLGAISKEGEARLKKKAS